MPTPTPAPAPAAADRLATPGRIPDDFPLTSGWAAGLEPPRRADADAPLCADADSGEPPDPTAVDRLLAAWDERRRTRQLTLYPDAASARAVVQVRRSVLLEVAGGLADGPHRARRARSIAADQVTWSARVVSAMGNL